MFELNKILILIIIQSLFNFIIETSAEKNVDLPNLPIDHVLRFLHSFPKLKENCKNAQNCHLPNASVKNATTIETSEEVCWGFERDCDQKQRFQTPICPGEHTGWSANKKTQINTFYKQADFGYVKQQLDELTLLCTPTYLTDSSLECSKYLRFCRGRNLFFDFRGLTKRKEMIRYHMDVLKHGELAGHCKLNQQRLNGEIDHMSALQSWAPELRNFIELPMPVMESEHCEFIVEKPTYLMKIDATYNMYHHFCDFFNLYATLFVNQSHPLAFDTDTQIILWETYPYDSPFADTFKAFTNQPVWTLNQVRGKRVCFRNVVLPLLPRMIFGLFYNTPIILGCQNSGLFRAFSEFILHRLEIPFEAPRIDEKIRITFLLRRTKYRQVLNEKDLLKKLESNPNYEVRRVSYEKLTFLKQLEITRNSDILIGMHGAGLTHLLFLPNWATIFELHNCDDPNCYKDLARLRGINYMTWEKSDLAYPEDEGHHPQGGAHAKFTNYAFDIEEFARLVSVAAKHVRSHNEFQYNHKKEAANLKEEL